MRNSSLKGSIEEASSNGLRSSWTDPITVYRTQNSIKNSGPAQGILQGMPSATREKSVYTYQKENPNKKWADAIKAVTGAAGAFALNSILPGSGSAVSSIMKAFEGGPENRTYSDGTRPQFTKALLTGEIDPLSGQPVDLPGFNGSVIKAPTGTRSILEDVDTSWTNKSINLPLLLEGKVKKEHIPLLTKGLSDNPLLNDMLIPKKLF
jgi:hypothetical protein